MGPLCGPVASVGCTDRERDGHKGLPLCIAEATMPVEPLREWSRPAPLQGVLFVSHNIPGHLIPSASLADAIGVQQVERYVSALDWFRQRRNDATVAALDRFLRDPWCDPDLQHAGAARILSLQHQFGLSGVLSRSAPLEAVRALCERVAAVYAGVGMRLEEDIVYWPDQRALLTIGLHVEMWRQMLRSRPSVREEMAAIAIAAEGRLGAEASPENEARRLRAAIEAAQARLREIGKEA